MRFIILDEKTKKDGFRLLTYIYSCCFHTTESHEEILACIEKIRAECSPSDAQYEMEPYVSLVHNLLNLHENLPGPAGKKNVKIYWNGMTEKDLILELFKFYTVNNIWFKVIEGEIIESNFQNIQIDFKYQLKYWAIDGKKFGKAFEDLVFDLFGENYNDTLDYFSKLVEEEIENKFYDKLDLKSDGLFYRSYFSLFIYNLFYYFKKSKENKTLPDFKTMAEEEQKKFLSSLYPIIKEGSNFDKSDVEIDFPLNINKDENFHNPVYG